MTKEKLTFRVNLERVDTRVRVTAKRIFQNLQIDGLTKPTYERIRSFILKIRKNDRKSGNSRSNISI